MKEYLGIFIPTVAVGLSGCASGADSEQVAKRIANIRLTGSKQIRATDGPAH